MPTQALSSKPICANCQHYLELRTQGIPYRCNHPSLRDIVTGSPSDCYTARSSARPCGPEARLFVERQEMSDELKEWAAKPLFGRTEDYCLTTNTPAPSDKSSSIFCANGDSASLTDAAKSKWLTSRLS